jgi:hypothetical protein
MSPAQNSAIISRTGAMPAERCRVAACIICGDDRSSKGGDIDMRLRFAARLREIASVNLKRATRPRPEPNAALY